jgi:hypothetical protein
MNPSNKPCNCYASQLDKMTQFSLRRGAHEVTCPEYKVSRDPVDAAKDVRIRCEYTQEQYPVG